MEGTLGPQNLTANITNYYIERSFSNLDICEICIYIVILVTGVTGNGLVIFVTGYKMKTTVNSIWFLNLAIADLIFILLLVRRIVVSFGKRTWTLGDFMCKCVTFLTMQNMFASVFFLTVISLDRCLCTWVVVWAQNKRTLVKARLICVFVWILSICCSIPYIMVHSVRKSHHGFEFCVSTSSTMFLNIYRFMAGFLIPFLIFVSSYVAIAVRAKRLKRRKHLRPFRVIISVILAFFICWFPYHVQKLCYMSGIKNHWHASVMMKLYVARPFVTGLVYLNSCLNPILYVFMCDEYKMILKKSLLLVLEGAFTEDHLGLR